VSSGKDTNKHPIDVPKARTPEGFLPGGELMRNFINGEELREGRPVIPGVERAKQETEGGTGHVVKKKILTVEPGKCGQSTERRRMSNIGTMKSTLYLESAVTNSSRRAVLSCKSRCSCSNRVC